MLNEIWGPIEFQFPRILSSGEGPSLFLARGYAVYCDEDDKISMNFIISSIDRPQWVSDRAIPLANYPPKAPSDCWGLVVLGFLVEFIFP